MTVRIGIPVPTSDDLEYNAKNEPQYAEAVRQAGAEVISIALALGKDWLSVARSCDGFLLPGSPADVDPSLYGQGREGATAPADPMREACDFAILEHAAERGKSVLAICFGMQRLNVWLGGTLVQDLNPVPVNHAAGASVAIAHTVAIPGQSLLAGLLSGHEAPSEGTFRRLPVNSSHHQAIGIVGDDLTVVARCSQDGVVEAVEGRTGLAAVIGVQWHPERSTSISGASRALFLWLVSEAEDAQMQRMENLGANAF